MMYSPMIAVPCWACAETTIVVYVGNGSTRVLLCESCIDIAKGLLEMRRTQGW